MLSKISVSHSPHISKPMSTRSVMVDVLISLAPAVLAAAILFRARAVILILACVIACALTEWLCNLARKIPKPLESLGDFSAVLTGVILALSLPPRLPVWAAVIGSAFAIAIGKMVFGGLGANVFNPAMAGRTFLTASFGALMTTWTVPATFDAAMPNVAITDSTQIVDARTTATPLGLAKDAIKERKKAAGLTVENETQAAEQALAIEKGRPGARYILSGADLRMTDMASIIQRLTGSPNLRLNLGQRPMLLASGLLELVSRISGRPPMSTRSFVRDQLGQYYVADGREGNETFGIKPRGGEAMISEAIRWLLFTGHIRKRRARKLAALFPPDHSWLPAQQA